MSVFTDDDLKRLKELAYVPIPAGQYLESTLDNQFLRNLLARLAAAENTIADPRCNTCCDMDKYNAWRKACGR